MDLTNREKRVLEAVTMHPRKGGSSRKDFCSYIAGATGFATSTSRDTLSSLKRKGALVGRAGQYYTLDSRYAQLKGLVPLRFFGPGHESASQHVTGGSEPEENGVEAPEEEEEEVEEQEEEEVEEQEEEEFENPAITASNIDLKRACRYLLKVMRKHNIQSVTLQKDGEIAVGQLWVEEHNLSLGK